MNKMSNNLDLIKKLNKELGDEPELNEPKTLQLLKEITKLLKDNKTNDNLDLVRKDLDNILDKIDFKDYSNEFNNLGILLKEIKNKEIKVDELEKLLNDLIEIISLQKFPKEIEVNNFPEQKEYPTKISIDNFPEQKTKIEVTNFPEENEFPKEIKVNNFPKKVQVDINKQIGIKKPVWYKPIILEPFISNIITALDTISEKIFKIDISKHKKAKEALAVKLVDKDGKFIDKLIPPIHISNPAGSGGGKKETSLLDENGSPITDSNPLPVKAELEVGDIEIGAVEIKDGHSDTRLDVELDDTKNAIYVQSESLATEDKQDDIIAGIQSLVGFEIPAYDYIALTYVASGNGAGEIETVTYKAGGDTVATLTLSYDADNNIISITKT